MTEQLLTAANEVLLLPTGLTQHDLQKVLDNILTHSVDAADLYLQTTVHESWVMEDSIVKSGTYSVEKGVGIRAISGEKTGFSYSSDLALPALKQAAEAARSIAHSGQGSQVKIWQQPAAHNLYSIYNPISSLNEVQKITILKQIDALARQRDSRVKQVIASLSGSHEVVMVAASDGTYAADIRPLVRINVQVIAEQNGRREGGSSGGGGRSDYAYFTPEIIAQYVNHAVDQALINLQAIPAPAGTFPVVLGPGWPGVLLHEAVGHGLEGDFNRKGTSAYAGRMGERVASPLCTVVDDGTLAGRRGSLNIDDEGTPTEYTVLIDRGILKGYMQDKLNARLMGMKPTGNARRESYTHLPMPRMTNTYMLAGEDDPKDIIASVEKGIYAVNFAGGQVDITSGKFVFSVNEAYLIENGKITAPIKGATLIGNGPEVLTRVSMVGNDLQLDSGIGVCGKDGQSVPVGVGQPTLKVDALTVGGTEE
jgi:TldD protein